jgi:hypothetical protein
MRKAALALILSLTLVVAGFSAPTPDHSATSTSHLRLEFHGGGMGNLDSHSSYCSCGAICQGVIGWIVGKLADAAVGSINDETNRYQQQAPTMGGGGGDGF